VGICKTQDRLESTGMPKSPNSLALQADYVTVVEDGPKCLQNIVTQLHFAKNDQRSSRAVSLRQLSLLFNFSSTRAKK